MAFTKQPGPVDRSLQAGLQGSLFGAGAVSCGLVTASFDPLDPFSGTLFEPSWVAGSDTVFETLRDEMPWRAMQRPMYDRVVSVPRLICSVTPSQFERTHPLAVITVALEKALNVSFSSIGLNFYRTGSDSVAWHRDSIAGTRSPLTVALVAVGSPRTLAMRRFQPSAHRNCSKPAETTRSPGVTPASAPRRWRLGHGDLLVMGGHCQSSWEHSVPKERGAGPRISLAFRSEDPPKGPRLAPTGVPPLLASHKLR